MIIIIIKIHVILILILKKKKKKKIHNIVTIKIICKFNLIFNYFILLTFEGIFIFLVIFNKESKNF